MKYDDIVEINGIRYIGRTFSAQILKVHPSTLRNWEKNDLFKGWKIYILRNKNGYTLYPVEGILRLRKRRRAWGDEGKYKRK